MYIAKHYVSIAGTVYTPGECFEAELSAQEEKRMLDLGAIAIDKTVSQANAEDTDYDFAGAEAQAAEETETEAIADTFADITPVMPKAKGGRRK